MPPVTLKESTGRMFQMYSLSFTTQSLRIPHPPLHQAVDQMDLTAIETEDQTNQLLLLLLLSSKTSSSVSSFVEDSISPVLLL
jgi:hypothetical protein